VHVAKPPETHDVCPCAQLSLQLSEHAAPGAMPEQDFGIAHSAVDATS
jgi:hypothetical protein